MELLSYRHPLKVHQGLWGGCEPVCGPQPECAAGVPKEGRGVWGTKSLWGRVLTYKPDSEPQPQP
jgi:hypothetical protein